MSSTGMHGCMHARLHASAAVPVKAGGGRGGWRTVSGWSSPNAAKPHGICVEDECQLAHYHRQRLVAHRHIILCALYTRHGVQAARPLVRSCLGWRAGSPPPPSFRRIHNSDAVRKPVHTQLVISPSLQPALGGTTVGGVLLPQGLWPDAELPQHRTERLARPLLPRLHLSDHALILGLGSALPLPGRKHALQILALQTVPLALLLAGQGVHAGLEQPPVVAARGGALRPLRRHC